MLDFMLAYQKTILKLLSDSPKNTNWPLELKYFNHLLAHFQHERLIHLLVTLTVGLACLIALLTTLFYPLPLLYLLDLILIILFFAYINHYRRLENTVQAWYPILHRLKQKLPHRFTSLLP